VTVSMPEIDHSRSCHIPGAAGKYQTGERDAASNQTRPNRKDNPMKLVKFMIPLLTAVLPEACVAQSQPGVAPGVPSVAIPKTTEVLVIQTAKQSITPQQIQQIVALMPAEIRATVKLYFDGKIRQWYSRGDGRGVVVLVEAKTEDEARALMETLPLAKEQLMDYEYVPVGPLMPLRALMGGGAARQ
jgi:hypothetical protein